MRIGLYGLPCAGKSYILDRIDFMEVYHGSKLLKEIVPDFCSRNEEGKSIARKTLAKMLLSKDNFIMDGHYSFGNEVAFTEEDGILYDAFLYVYVDPDTIKERMRLSSRNTHYLSYDIDKWQNSEIEALREYAHQNCKDFYVLDNPPSNTFMGVSILLEFISEVNKGFSSLKFAKACADDILMSTNNDVIVLADGDKTITIEDSSSKIFGYMTHLFDGNYYTGYQSWRQWKDFSQFKYRRKKSLPVQLRRSLIDQINLPLFILTSGHSDVWHHISDAIGAKCYCGKMMSAETKYYITRFLQMAGRKVIAYGDSMNDYYMLIQADQGYLITKEDGTISRSLKGKKMEGLICV